MDDTFEQHIDDDVALILAAQQEKQRLEAARAKRENQLTTAKNAIHQRFENVAYKLDLIRQVNPEIEKDIKVIYSDLFYTTRKYFPINAYYRFKTQITKKNKLSIVSHIHCLDLDNLSYLIPASVISFTGSMVVLTETGNFLFLLISLIPLVYTALCFIQLLWLVKKQTPSDKTIEMFAMNLERLIDKYAPTYQKTIWIK